MEKHIRKDPINLLRAFYIIPLFMLFVATTSCEKEDGGSLINSTAPAFTLDQLGGGEVSLSDYQGKVVVLFFLGSGCPSCKAATPSIQSELVEEFMGESDYILLGLDQWNGQPAAVESFKNSTGATFPILMNASGVASDYKTTYDRLVVIDKTGKIVFSGSRGAASDVLAVKEKVENLLGSTSGTGGTTLTPAPDFSLTSLSGSTQKLSDYKGKVVVLFFLGSTCPLCKAVAPSIESTFVTPYTGNTNLKVLGLDTWDGNNAALAGFRSSTSTTFALLLNASQVATLYSTNYDRLVVINKAGEIAFKGTNSAATDLQAAKAKVESLLLN